MTSEDAIITATFTLIGAFAGSLIGYFTSAHLEKVKSKYEIKKIKVEFGLTSRINAYQEFSKLMRDIRTLNYSICSSKSHDDMKKLVENRNELFTKLTAIDKGPYMNDEKMHSFYNEMNEYIPIIDTQMNDYLNPGQNPSSLGIASTTANKTGLLCNRVDDHIQKVISKELELDEIKS